MTPMIHLVAGSTGAGKTTYARALAQEIGGVRFSIDEWMVRLFGPDAPAALDIAWVLPRVARCETQIWSLAAELGRLGTPSVLDLGLQRAERRAQVAAQAREAGLGVQLHVLDVPAAERWARVEARNSAKGETYHLTVSRPMFDHMESLWERPNEAEMAALNGVVAKQN